MTAPNEFDEALRLFSTHALVSELRKRAAGADPAAKAALYGARTPRKRRAPKKQLWWMKRAAEEERGS